LLFHQKGSNNPTKQLEQISDAKLIQPEKERETVNPCVYEKTNLSLTAPPERTPP
jgi:hypothetical protein